MSIYKLLNKNLLEKIFFYAVLLFIFVTAIITNDNKLALVSAICGISYTYFAGKGKPYCYIFGVTGSAFYCLISFQNELWGNLLLYSLYYIPMQVCGFFSWNKNLKDSKKEILKERLSKKEYFILYPILFSFVIITYLILNYFNDAHPLLDSITTVLSIGGMYLTVRRAIEQWIFWMFVNALSLLMWLNVALNGAKVYSTIAMWFVYLVLAFYFYFEWKKELK